MSDFKVCTLCKESKPASDIVKGRKHCRVCWAAKQCEWRKQNPEKTKVYAKTWRARNPQGQAESNKRWNEKNPEIRKEHSRAFRLTEDQYHSLCENQDFKCKICGEVKKLFIDHCHATNKLRGLLCQQCNSGLGFFKDKPQFMITAAEYVAKKGDV